MTGSSITRLLAAAAFAGGLFAVAAPTTAATVAPPRPAVAAPSDEAQPAGWRCGPGRHMNRNGRCVRNRR